jgi:radical SAM protein with 4Fe4S-binding SPASM domain
MAGAPQRMMPLETFERLVEDLSALGTLRVDLVGRGEPLLHPQVEDMMRFAKRRGLFVSVTTNASKLTARCAATMIEAGVDALRVSLNAGRRETYGTIHVGQTPESYDATRARISTLTRARAAARAKLPEVTLSFTISKRNASELTEMVEAIAAVGADAGHFQHVIPRPPPAPPLALDADELARLENEWVPSALRRARSLGVATNLASFIASHRDGAPEEPVPCHVGSYFTVVLGNGAILPCCQTKTALGHVEEGFRSVWRGERYRAFRRAAQALPRPSPELATCECDRCYFRPHNLSVERVVHPLRSVNRGDHPLIGVRQLVRMSRTRRAPES